MFLNSCTIVDMSSQKYRNKSLGPIQTLDRKLIERRILTEASPLVHLLFGCVPWDTAARVEAKNGSTWGWASGLQLYKCLDRQAMISLM